MALVNRAWRESRFVPPGAEPGLTAGREFVEHTQNLAVSEIARSRFPYPTEAEPQLKTYVNRPEHTIGVRGPTGDLLFPDIVVMDTATTETAMLAEIETARSLRLPDTTEKWQAFAAVGRLYLYVPYSEVERTRALLRDLRIAPAALRLWKLNLGQQTVEVLELPL